VTAQLREDRCDIRRVFEGKRHEHSAYATEIDIWEEVEKIESQHPLLTAMKEGVRDRAPTHHEPVDVHRRLITGGKHFGERALHVFDRLNWGMDLTSRPSPPTDLKSLVTTLSPIGVRPPRQRP